MPTKLIPYTDGEGKRHWVEVEADLKREIETFDRAMRRRNAEHRRRHRTNRMAERWTEKRKTDKAYHIVGYLNVELEPAFKAINRGRTDVSPWEGPRYSFTLLLGENETWDGPDGSIVETPQGWRCRGCGHYHTMPEVAYCLHCDRSGRDGEAKG